MSDAAFSSAVFFVGSSVLGVSFISVLSVVVRPSSVHGIIPRPLIKFEQTYDYDNTRSNHIDESIYGRTTAVSDMHTRKQLMAREVIAGGPGSGFVALSGGYGTLEELMEVTTWNQLGIHAMPVALFNVCGYWSGLMEWAKNAVSSGFVSSENEKVLSEASIADEGLRCLRDFENAPGRFQLTWEGS